MKIFAHLLLALTTLIVSACTPSELKQATYETVQNIGDAQCQKQLSAPCRPRESYSSYQHKRTAVAGDTQ
jgi:hypothetical protein